MSEATGRIRLQPAFVLRQQPYRDSSEILEILTVDHGRMGVVARGSRGPRSRLRGLLRPFSPLLMSMSLRGDLATLTGAEMAGRAVPLGGEALFGGYYLNELILRLTHRHDPCPTIFDAYQDALAGMAGDDTDLAPALRRFEKRLLDALGYGLQLEFEAGTGDPIQPGQWYEYRVDSGPRLLDASRQARLGVHGETLLALADDRLDSQPGLQEAQRLLRACLDAQLGGRPLKTREVLLAMKRR